MSEQVTERKLTIKDLNTSYFMFEVFAQACCSYERLQAPGFFSGMKNVIAKLYTDPEERAEACQRHMEFYNSEFALVGPVILGLTIAMEEEKACGAEIDGLAISAVKTSLMGPLAGIGDTLRQGTLIPIIGSSIAMSIPLVLASVGGAACMEAGTVANATEQSIYATQSGQVASLPIQAGTAVTAGQTVMTLENASLTNAVTNASLSVESAQVNLAQLEAKRADYTVTAPVDGTVLERPFKTGDYAAAATSLATLVQPDSLCVSVEIDELYINQVGVGQQARITFADGQTHEARDYDGIVSRMDDTGVSSGGGTDYSVEISLTRTEELKAGMNVTVEILVAQSEDCMSVPSEAVTGGVVRVLRDGAREPVEVPVETGLSGDGVTEIRSGLSPEDWVVVDAY